MEEREDSGSWSGFAVTLKIQSENSDVCETAARERVEGLKAAQIGLTSCPECCIGAGMDIHNQSRFEIKAPSAAPFTPDLSAYLSLLKR